MYHFKIFLVCRGNFIYILHHALKFPMSYARCARHAPRRVLKEKEIAWKPEHNKTSQPKITKTISCITQKGQNSQTVSIGFINWQNLF